MILKISQAFNGQIFLNFLKFHHHLQVIFVLLFLIYVLATLNIIFYLLNIFQCVISILKLLLGKNIQGKIVSFLFIKWLFSIIQFLLDLALHNYEQFSFHFRVEHSLVLLQFFFNFILLNFQNFTCFYHTRTRQPTVFDLKCSLFYYFIMLNLKIHFSIKL